MTRTFTITGLPDWVKAEDVCSALLTTFPGLCELDPELAVEEVPTGRMAELPAARLPAKNAYDSMKERRDEAPHGPEYREANTALRPFGKALADIEQQMRIELLEALR